MEFPESGGSKILRNQCERRKYPGRKCSLFLVNLMGIKWRAAGFFFSQAYKRCLLLPSKFSLLLTDAGPHR
jgi:hypothetical protein